MRKISDLLGVAVRRPEVLRRARAQKVMRQWPEVVGELLNEHTTPERYADGTVWVAADGSAWAQELRLRKEDVVQRLNELAGERFLFTDVRVGTRRAKVEKPGESE